jgi:bacterioferritin-associated ferredoxin
MYVCICNAVAESAISEAVADGASSLEALRARLGVGAGCGSCDQVVESMLRQQANRAEPMVYRPMVSASA